MSKLLKTCMACVLVFSFVRFDSSIAADPYNDSDAAHASELSSHTVKVSWDVELKDVLGNEKTVDDAMSGSGAVVAVYENKSLVLTAEHVCDAELEPGDTVMDGRYVVENVSMHIIMIDSTKHSKVKILRTDTSSDLCIIEVMGIVGTPASLAPFKPPINAKVMTAGAPLGEWDTVSANIVEGRYSGISKEPIVIDWFTSFDNFAQYSIPIIGGMSGSAVYYRGRIVGILTVGVPTYSHLAWGPFLPEVTEFVKAALEDWREVGID